MTDKDVVNLIEKLEQEGMTAEMIKALHLFNAQGRKKKSAAKLHAPRTGE